MGFINDFLAWAWARHHNILSWYIRPLFFIPFCYFAYKRRIWGVIITVIGLLTSMFWFPEPKNPSPEVIEFLNAEMQYLSSNWDFQKILITLSIPAIFYLLGLAFWKRSVIPGLIVINLSAIGKTIWSVVETGDSGWAILIPAVFGIALCNLVVIFGYRWIKKRKKRKRKE